MSDKKDPTERIQDLTKALRDIEYKLVRVELALQGRCPDCLQHVTNWKVPFFSEEWMQSWRERGIDPTTGHKLNCLSEDWGLFDDEVGKKNAS